MSRRERDAQRIRSRWRAYKKGMSRDIFPRPQGGRGYFRASNASFRSVQEETRAQLAERVGVLLRANLLIKQHGQELCKRSRPKCGECPVTADCRYFAAVAE